MKIIHLVSIFTIFIGSAAFVQQVSAESKIEVQPVEYTFNQEIKFQALFHSDKPVELAVIYFQRQGDTQTFVELATMQKLENGDYEISYVHPISTHPFQAFTKIEYRFEIMQEGGDFYKTPQYEFLYADNRFKWESLQEGPFIVYWFKGDYAFAQSILDVAQEGLQKIKGLLPLPEPSVLHIYVYPDSKLMKEAMEITGQEWIAGHAFPDLETMIIYLPTGSDQVLDMRQRIPHEIMHIMLYQYTNPGYPRLPFWLSEGLASLAELYPNQDYPILLENAVKKDGLMPMATLCEGFPRDASGALLAYAQSASFTEYLYDHYGTSGMDRLISNYANGVDCEVGTQAAFGAGLQQLERRWWRDSLSKSPVRTAFTNLLPWLAFLLVIFIAPIVLLVINLQSKSKVRNPVPKTEGLVNSPSNERG
jgi:hypothetical protein